MSNLCILGCQNFQPEMQACVSQLGCSDVSTVAFPARCGRPPLQWSELRDLLPKDCSEVVVLGRACLAQLKEKPADFPPTRVLVQEQCFHLIAGPSLVASLLAQRAYLMTPEWLLHWQQHVEELGFSTSSAAEFFQDFASSLILLDTGIHSGLDDRLAECERAMGLVAQRIAVGLDYLTPLVERVVLQWRLGQLQTQQTDQMRQHAAEQADQVLAMDMLGRISKSRLEADVLAAVEDMFRMLFAPKEWYFVSAEAPQGTVPFDTQTPYGWNRTGDGFIVRITREERVLGHIVVEGLAFPQYRDRYLNLALAVADTIALALESARTRRRLVEAEKMASLGVMVAGVAHEINTPVGVGVLAASTLQSRTAGLNRQFAERSMTQSDLTGFLKDADDQATLILSNLERVGRLIDKFRQVAVNGLPQMKNRFHVLACLQDVLQSFGDHIAKQHVEVRIVCDEALELESYSGDWTSIFTNFIANSMQHGFKERASGVIEITVAPGNGVIAVDYCDNGVGLTAQALTRIFDPFFTTDMQNGIGLGMHLVYNLITQRLNGQINVQGSPGNGVWFHIEVPHSAGTRAMV